MRKEVDKILKKIDTITKLGKDGYFDYCNYVDNLVSESKYGYLELALMNKYFIDITQYLSVNDMKKSTYTKILFYMNQQESKDIKKLYDANSIYAVGYNIYRLSDNNNLGQIKEINRLDLHNKIVLSESGTPIIDLMVTRGLTSSNITDGTTLIDKYKSAITLLVS